MLVAAMTVLCAGIFTIISAQAVDSAGMQSPPADSSQQLADRIVKSRVPVLVDFWAPWCGPCRLLLPTIKQLEKEYRGKVLFMRINTDVHRAIANYFGISAIPAVFIIKDKTVVSALRGLRPKEDYVAALAEVLKPVQAVPQKPNDPPGKTE